jgi:RNA polymerase sigma factor (sigma-70 family)
VTVTPGSNFTGKGATRGRLLEDYGREGHRGRRLRSQLKERFPRHSEEEIEDAVQTACRCFLDSAPGIDDPGSAYAWIRTVAFRSMSHEYRAQGRLVPLAPAEGELGGAVVDGRPGPVEELIDLEDTAELEILVREVASSLSDQRRQILVLWAAGRKKPEIAAELGLSERAVKRGLEEVMRQAREVLARRTGGGCEEGESLVLRFACGLAGAGEAIRARTHMERCGSCSTFAEQLEAWREKAGVVLGPAAVEIAHPGLVGRVVGRAGDAISSAKRHVLGGAEQVKQQAAAGYARTPDPTPLAGVRPGTLAAVVVSCLAVGTGAATYCAQQGVDPLAAATGLIAGTEEEKEPAPPEKEPRTPVVTDETPAETVTEPTYVPAEESQSPVESGSKESKEHPAAEKQAGPEPEPEPEREVTPPPEQSFEPASPDYTATESTSSESSSSSSSSSAATSEASQAKAVPANESPQFGGP